MPSLRQQLEGCLAGSVCFIGLGNTHYSDDGFGVRLAEQLIAGGMQHVLVAGTAPDRFLGRLVHPNFDHVIFLDAADFGSAPGSTVFLNSSEMAARYPQISTHKVSLALLAQFVEAGGSTKAWLLGVQPESVKVGEELTATIKKSLAAIAELLLSLTNLESSNSDSTSVAESSAEMKKAVSR